MEMNKQESSANDIGLNMYQKSAMKTAVFSNNDYPLMALAEEVGEVMGKIAKHCRKSGMDADEAIHLINYGALPELKEALLKEMGDVLWQWAVLCQQLGLNAADVAAANLTKLQDRQERNVLNGEGDNR